MTEQCGNCRFLRKRDHSCHRWPPSRDFNWPAIDSWDWCGEWRPLPFPSPEVLAADPDAIARVDQIRKDAGFSSEDKI